MFNVTGIILMNRLCDSFLSQHHTFLIWKPTSPYFQHSSFLQILRVPPCPSLPKVALSCASVHWVPVSLSAASLKGLSQLCPHGALSTMWVGLFILPRSLFRSNGTFIRAQACVTYTGVWTSQLPNLFTSGKTSCRGSSLGTISQCPGVQWLLLIPSVSPPASPAVCALFPQFPKPGCKLEHLQSLKISSKLQILLYPGTFPQAVSLLASLGAFHFCIAWKFWVAVGDTTVGPELPGEIFFLFHQLLYVALSMCGSH